VLRREKVRRHRIDNELPDQDAQRGYTDSERDGPLPGGGAAQSGDPPAAVAEAERYPEKEEEEGNLIAHDMEDVVSDDQERPQGYLGQRKPTLTSGETYLPERRGEADFRCLGEYPQNNALSRDFEF
jgi:hypothetical protein